MKKRSRWKERSLAVVLSLAMVFASVNLPSFALTAQAAENLGTITEIKKLDSSIQNQKLQQGATEEKILFPDTLDVMVTHTVEIEPEATSNSEVQQTEPSTSQDEQISESETQGEDFAEQTQEPSKEETESAEQDVSGGNQKETTDEKTLETITEDKSVSVTWTLNKKKSSADTFSSEEVGATYTYDATLTENYTVADGVSLPEITVTIEKKFEAEFNKSQTIDGVNVTVLADEGVFPAGATLSVSKVDASTEEKVTDNVDAAREDNVNVAKSYTFDIKVLDKDGNEIQPNTTKGQVKVSFALVEVTNDNLDVDVYHISDEILTDDSKSAEKLDSNVETVEGTEAVVAETTGFSYYTVEFTYNNLQYVMNGDSKIALADILDYVGLTGTVTNATSSNPELFSVAEEDGKCKEGFHIK